MCGRSRKLCGTFLVAPAASAHVVCGDGVDTKPAAATHFCWEQKCGYLIYTCILWWSCFSIQCIQVFTPEKEEEKKKRTLVRWRHTLCSYTTAAAAAAAMVSAPFITENCVQLESSTVRPPLLLYSVLVYRVCGLWNPVVLRQLKPSVAIATNFKHRGGPKKALAKWKESWLCEKCKYPYHR